MVYVLCIWYHIKGTICFIPSLMYLQLYGSADLETDSYILFLRMSKSLMKRLLPAYNLEKCPATAWGITNEKTAVANYTSLGASVDETGTCTLKLWGD